MSSGAYQFLKEPNFRRLVLLVLIATLFAFPVSRDVVNAKVTNLTQHVFAKGIDKGSTGWKPVNITSIVGIPVEDLSWRFDINDTSNPFHAYVNLTVTIHPHNGLWQNYTFDINALLGRGFSAYEFGTNKRLLVTTQELTDVTTEVDVAFDSGKGEGYRFTLSFELAGTFGKVDNSLFLTWTWSNGIHPRPEDVTVILPQGFDFVRVEGGLSGNYTLGNVLNRTTVSFRGVAQPNDAFHWVVFYRQPLQTTTSISSTSTSSSAEGLSAPSYWIIPAIGITIVILGFFIARTRSKKSRPA